MSANRALGKILGPMWKYADSSGCTVQDVSLRSLVFGIGDSNSTGNMDVILSVMCCQVAVYESV